MAYAKIYIALISGVINMSRDIKHYEEELSTCLVTKAAPAQSVHTRCIIKKCWPIILFMWLVILLAQSLSSFVLPAWPGFVLGLIFSVVTFVLGFYAIEKVIQREIQYTG